MIRNIIFDLGGILVGLDPKRSIAAFREIGAMDVASYIEDHRTEDLFLDIELGCATTERFCQSVRDIAHCQASDREIIGAWNALLTQFQPHKLETLKQLSKHYRLFLLSNTNDMHWQHCRRLCQEASGRDLCHYFSRCFLSYEMGMAKPSVEIFAETLRQADLKAEETLFIDDTKANCQAAEEIGITSLFDPDGTHWEEELTRNYLPNEN